MVCVVYCISDTWSMVIHWPYIRSPLCSISEHVKVTLMDVLHFLSQGDQTLSGYSTILFLLQAGHPTLSYIGWSLARTQASPLQSPNGLVSCEKGDCDSYGVAAGGRPKKFNIRSFLCGENSFPGTHGILSPSRNFSLLTLLLFVCCNIFPLLDTANNI